MTARAAAWLTALLLTSAALAPASAGASQLASISAGFSPERLGAQTTLSLGFAIRTPDGSLPSALTGVVFHFPRTLGLITNELGVATCSPATLAKLGPKACPANSIMGGGSALAKFQVSPEVSEETASLAIVAGPSQGGFVRLLISATGTYPVAARIVMTTLVLPGTLQFGVPLVAGVPEGPDVAVVEVKIKIGGRLTYYRRAHGRRLAYHPRGIELPRSCPHGGFRFDATFSFLDGSSAQAKTSVNCPRGR